MQTIKVKSSFSTEIFPELNSVQTIEIPDTIIGNGEGAFGKVYECISINRSACSVDQVIKILTLNKDIHKKGYEAIQKLQTKLKSKNQEINRKGKDSILEEYPALKAIPQISFTGTLNGKEVFGYSANNLNSLGFISFTDALDKNLIQHEVLENKIPMIYHLVNAFEFLNSIFFIHADLKDDALFINTSTKECAIIDFDSGAIADGNNDQPTTIGSLQEWLAPEIMEQFGKSSFDQHEITINLNSDRWSITVAIFYLICSSHPFFMLRNTANETITDYFSKYQWPEIDQGEAYFNKDNEPFYNQFIIWYKHNLSSGIKKIFETTFTQGYSNPALRSSYSIWKLALKNIQKAPEIKSFGSNIKIRINSTPVTLQWNVDHEEELILQPGNISVTGINSYDVNPLIDTTYTLIAKNYCGEHKQKVEIKISKSPPKIRIFQANTLIRTGVDSIKLSWEVDNYSKLILNPGNISVNGKKGIEVEPLIDTTYTLEAKSLFGIESRKSLSIKISDEPPVIKEFKSDTPFRMDHTPVKLHWDTEKAHRLYLTPGNIDVTGKTSIGVEPLNATTYILVAESYFGAKTEVDLNIDVSKEPPLIKKLEYEPIDLIENVFKLTWEVDNAESIEILPSPGDVTNKTDIEVELVDNQKFTLTATSLFGVQISKNINIKTLFNFTLPDHFFNEDPKDDIFNLKINSNLNTKPHGN